MQIPNTQSNLPADAHSASSDAVHGSWLVRVKVFVGLVCLSAALFILPLASLFRYALHNELNSHVLLMPVVFIYLLRIRWKQLPDAYASSPGWSLLAAAAGVTSLAAAWFGSANHLLSPNDYLTLTTFAFVCCIVAAGFVALGGKWMRAAAFPFAILLFMVPLPDQVVDILETGSKLASAEAADWFFTMTGTSVLRTGTVFQLPGITIRVAQACSGIRSSWVLFITGLLAGNMFLKSNWRRMILVAFIIPLGILRNGFRILVIALLCIHFGPDMIDSPIHHKGGPLFFALSLIPFFLLLLWLRHGETRRIADGERRAPKEL